MKISFELNGQPTTVDAPPMKRLLDVLREDCGRPGTKEGCGEGECGACAVLIDGELATSCLVPAVQADGTQVKTVEGLASGEALAPLQQQFLECNAAQCGICTPGMLVAARFYLDGKQRLPGETIPEALAGNLCRCTGYEAIFQAVERTQRLESATRPSAKKPAKKAAVKKAPAKKKSAAKKSSKKAATPKKAAKKKAVKPVAKKAATKAAKKKPAAKKAVKKTTAKARKPAPRKARKAGGRR